MLKITFKGFAMLLKQCHTQKHKQPLLLGYILAEAETIRDAHTHTHLFIVIGACVLETIVENVKLWKTHYTAAYTW